MGGWSQYLTIVLTYSRGVVHSPQCQMGNILVFSCDQAALSALQSVCLSVRLSVTHFSQCFCHRIIMKFSGVLTNHKSDVHAIGQGQRSKVKVTEVKTQLGRSSLLFFETIHQISMSQGLKNRRFVSDLGRITRPVAAIKYPLDLPSWC